MDSLVELNKKLYVSTKILSDISTDIDEQAQAMLRARENNLKATAHGMNEDAQAQAPALFISTELLGNTLGTAALNYKSAAETLSTYSSQIDKIAARVRRILGLGLRTDYRGPA